MDALNKKNTDLTGKSSVRYSRCDQLALLVRKLADGYAEARVRGYIFTRNTVGG